jgi:hypothetical protein
MYGVYIYNHIIINMQKEIKEMDNEELLELSEYKVKRARVISDIAEAEMCIRREILDMAKVEMRIRRETVRIEKENKQQMTDGEAYLKKLGIPAIVYKMATSVEELLVMISDKKAFLKRNGFSEKELEP